MNWWTVFSTANLQLSTHRVCFSKEQFWINTNRVAEGAGSGSWSKAYKKAKAFVGKLTHEEKVSLTSGAKEDVVDNGCAGNIGPIERVRFPGMCLADASQGVVS